MAAPLLADKLGGDILMSFVCAVAFATILAVVAGLVLSGASAFAHDIYGEIIKKGNISEREQMKAAKIASLAVSVLSILLALFAQNMNVAFLVSLAFCVAASANLPVIVFTIFWKRFNTQGAILWTLNRVNNIVSACNIKPECYESGRYSIYYSESNLPISESSQLYLYRRIYRCILRNVFK